jgi:hypothetical protein
MCCIWSDELEEWIRDRLDKENLTPGKYYPPDEEVKALFLKEKAEKEAAAAAAKPKLWGPYVLWPVTLLSAADRPFEVELFSWRGGFTLRMGGG